MKIEPKITIEKTDKDGRAYIAYCIEGYAIETLSDNIEDELFRRIAFARGYRRWNEIDNGTEYVCITGCAELDGERCRAMGSSINDRRGEGCDYCRCGNPETWIEADCFDRLAAGFSKPADRNTFVSSTAAGDAITRIMAKIQGAGNDAAEPEVIGADGLPIKVGETVYHDGGIFEVQAVCKGAASDEFGEWYDAGLLTHAPHDTQERIDDDATMYPHEYCKEHGIQAGTPDDAPFTLSDFVEPMTLDLLRRQRELDARTMGGE